MVLVTSFLFVFFFNDTATTEIYTLSLHDALPISGQSARVFITVVNNPGLPGVPASVLGTFRVADATDRKSTRLNSSHSQISYAVFCLKKKKKSNSLTLRFHAQHSECTS